MYSDPLRPAEKIPLMQKYKESAICAILREKNPILRHSQRLKRVLHVLRCATNAPQRPQRMQIPRGYQKKKDFVKKVCDFVEKVEISVWRGVEWVPKKGADCGATALA